MAGDVAQHECSNIKYYASAFSNILIKRKKKHNIKNKKLKSYHCILRKQIILIN